MHVGSVQVQRRLLGRWDLRWILWFGDENGKGLQLQTLVQALVPLGSAMGSSSSGEFCRRFSRVLVSSAEG